MKTLALVLATCAACSPAARNPGGGDDDDTGVDASHHDIDAPSHTVDGDNTGPSLVYAHSATTLYRVDTTTFTQTEIGSFAINDSITDIAVDKNGNMVGVTADTLYSIDVTTAKATKIKTLSNDVLDATGLGYVPDPNNPGADLLITADAEGNVFQIDPVTGNGTQVGTYGTSNNKTIGSSGDVFGVRNFGIYASVKLDRASDGSHDYLAKIDPSTWSATIVGNTGFDNIYGIGFWGGTIYGFDDAGDVLSIDKDSGVATKMPGADGVTWWGAGVTTNAPIVIGIAR